MRTGLVLAALTSATTASQFTNRTHCPTASAHKFKSSHIQTPELQHIALPDAAASQYVVIHGLADAGPMILDGEDLSLVYADQRHSNVSGLAVKELSGSKYLSFKENGNNVVLDEQYQLHDGLQLEDTHSADLLTEMDTGLNNCTGWKNVTAYRLSKFHWQGRPTWPPHIVVDAPQGSNTGSAAVFLSWNGATEVQSWAILASHNATTVNYYKNVIALMPRSGFETAISLNDTSRRYIGAAAIGVDGGVLGSTFVVDMETGQPVMLSSGITRITAPARAPSVAAGAMGGTIFGVSMLFYAFNYFKKRKESAAEVVEEAPRYSKVRFAV